MKAKLVKESLNESMGGRSIFLDLYEQEFGTLNPELLDKNPDYSLGGYLSQLEETDGLEEEILNAPGINPNFGVWNEYSDEDFRFDLRQENEGDVYDFQQNLKNTLNLKPLIRGLRPKDYLYTEYDAQAKVGWIYTDQFDDLKTWFYEI